MRRLTILAVTAIVAFATPAAARMDFAAMPVGCGWTTEYSNGNTWRETFVGKQGKAYVTEVREGSDTGALVARKRFDAKGRMIERTWANGKWERFKPFSCYGEPGVCEYTYSNADGLRQTIVNKTVSKSKGFIVRAQAKGSAPFPDETYRTGQFGVMIANRGGDFTSHVVSFHRCDAASS